MSRLALFPLVSLAACFQPAYEEGIACSADGLCPAPLMCVQGACRRTPAGADADGSPRDASGVEPGEADAAAASVDAAQPDAAPPDATPVECDDASDCQSPPNSCLLPGSCDLTSHTCRFEAVDCSQYDGECTRGACDQALGCVARPRNEDVTCGAGRSCGPYQPCDGYADVCDQTGSQTRACTVYTCRSGQCVSHPEEETAACSRSSTDGISCGDPTITGCGACGGFDSVCDETGRWTCTCTSHVCGGGVCGTNAVDCVQDCAIDTDGQFCGFNGLCEDGLCREQCLEPESSSILCLLTH